MRRGAMEIVGEDEFRRVFREAGRLDVLAAGTGCPQRAPGEGGVEARRTVKKKAARN